VKKRSRLSRIPLPRRPLEWVLAIVAVALIAIGVTSLGSGSSSSAAATKRTSTVGKGVVQSTVSGNGTLEPAQKVELSFGASGEVTKIYAKAGEKVTKGEVLAEVDSSSARASLASAEAALLEAEEAVETAAEAEGETEETAYEGESATTELVDLVEGATGTAAPTVEGEVAPTEGEATESTAAQEKAERETEKAKKEEEAAKKAAAKAKHEAAAATKEAAAGGSRKGESGTTDVESAGATGDSAAGATTTGGESSGATTSSGGETTGAAAGASISLPTAEANLREAELTVKSARQEVRETTLRAPISGTIASVSGSVGETVTGGSSSGGGTSEAAALGAAGGESTGGESSGSAFMVLAQLHRLKMEVSFSEADIGKVRKGQTATVAVDSMEGTELAGEVTRVSVLPSEGSSGVVEYPATILLTQSAKGLRAGMSASAEVVVEQVKDAVTVPSEAITAVGSSKTVTVEEDGREVTKTVKTGLEGDETTEVISGLKAGQTLILPEVTVAKASGGEGESGSKEGFAGFGAAAAAGGFGGGFATGGGPPGFGGR
jgi:multidrug efflux pump subunit AcrA (membrane-fusion protein)